MVTHPVDVAHAVLAQAVLPLPLTESQTFLTRQHFAPESAQAVFSVAHGVLLESAQAAFCFTHTDFRESVQALFFASPQAASLVAQLV
jgi:hypothetical protein